METPVTGISIDRIAGYTVPEQPTPIEVVFTSDTEQAVVLPYETNYVVFDSDIPVYFSFEVNGTADPTKRYFCRNSLPYLQRQKFGTIYIKPRSGSAAEGTVHLILGS